MIPVLYVDDDKTLLSIGKLFLERSGDFLVTVAESADEGIDLINKGTFEAVVSDYQMPDMDGIQFLRYLREKKNDIPFILFTGKGRESVVIEALNNGADFYLQKGGDPIAQFFELGSKIQQAVRRKRAEDTLKKRIEILTKPYADIGSLSFDDLFELNKIQIIQDAFSNATGIPSIITKNNGFPVTSMSDPDGRFLKLISTSKMFMKESVNEEKSHAYNESTNTIIQECLGGYCLKAKIAIIVGKSHIGDWHLGEVLSIKLDSSKFKDFIRETGVNEDEASLLIHELTKYSKEEFSKFVFLLERIIEHLNSLGFQNIQQAWEITRIRKNEKNNGENNSETNSKKIN